LAVAEAAAASPAQNPTGKNEIRVRIANLIDNSYGDIQESGRLGPVTVQTAAAGK